MEEISKLERKLHIEVPVEMVRSAFERAYKKVQKDTTLKGFRKGKVPIGQIKSLYVQDVQSKVLNQMVQSSYVQAMTEKQLHPIGSPKFHISSIEEDKPFKFSFEVEIRPEINLKIYKGLEVEKEILDVNTEHVVNKVIENLRNQKAETTPVLDIRPAQMGDVVRIDFNGTVNGQPLNKGSAKDYDLELGSQSFIPGFEEGIVGMNINETKTLNLTFPEDYSKDLANVPVQFEIQLKSLNKKRLPEVNDEFAKSIGLENFKSMKQKILEDHINLEKKRIKEDLRKRIIKVLVDKNPVEAPSSLVKEQKNLLIEDVKKNMTTKGLSEEDFKSYVKKWDAQLQQSAHFMVCSSFLIHEISDKENLKSTGVDVDVKIKEYARQTGMDIKKIQDFYTKKENVERLRFKISEDKVVDFLLSQSKIKEVPKDKISQLS